jgi:hypothetical protein
MLPQRVPQDRASPFRRTSRLTQRIDRASASWCCCRASSASPCSRRMSPIFSWTNDRKERWLLSSRGLVTSLRQRGESFWEKREGLVQPAWGVQGGAQGLAGDREGLLPLHLVRVAGGQLPPEGERLFEVFERAIQVSWQQLLSSATGTVRWVRWATVPLMASGRAKDAERNRSPAARHVSADMIPAVKVSADGRQGSDCAYETAHPRAKECRRLGVQSAQPSAVERAAAVGGGG